MTIYFTPEKAAELLRDIEDGHSIQALATRHKVAYQTVWQWKPYVGLDASWLRKVKTMEVELRALTRRYAEQEKNLEVAAQLIRQLEPSPRLRGLMVAAIRANYGLRRIDANKILGITYSAGSARPVRKNNDALVAAMRAYLAENPGHGFNPMFKILLQHRPSARQTAIRLYQDAGLQFDKRKNAKAPLPQRVKYAMEVQGAQDKVWSMDFMLGLLPGGDRFYVLNVIDDFNREAMITKVIPQSTTKCVIESLARVLRTGRRPKVIRTDNGGEFKSKQFIEWTKRRGIERRYIRPGKSIENAFVESFNNSVRREVLNSYHFKTMDDVQRMLDDWRLRYNFGRPHKALRGLSPLQYAYLSKSGMH